MGYELAVGGELLHPVVVEVGDVNEALLVHGNAPGRIQLPLAAAVAAPGTQERSVQGEPADFVAPPVGDIQGLVGADGDAGGAVGPGLVLAHGVPVSEEPAVLVEHGDSVQPFVGDVQVAPSIGDDSGGPDELAVGVPVAAEFADKGFFARAFPNSHLADASADAGAVPSHVADAFAAPVDDVQDVVLAQGRGHGVGKPHACCRAASHAVAVIVGPARDCFCQH